MQLQCPKNHPYKECSSHQQRNAQHHAAVAQRGDLFLRFFCVYCQRPIPKKGWSFSCGVCRQDMCSNCWLFWIKRDSLLYQHFPPRIIRWICPYTHVVLSCVNENQKRGQCAKFDPKYAQTTVPFLCTLCKKDIKRDPMLTCPQCLLFTCGECSLSSVLSAVQQHKNQSIQTPKRK